MSAEGVKPTAGPWEVRWEGLEKNELIVRSLAPLESDYEESDWHPIVVDLFRGGRGNKADAFLIAEAGTVLHETGRTPRQLADEVERLKVQRDALLAAAKRADRTLEGVGYSYKGHHRRHLRTAISLAEQQAAGGQQ